MFKKLHYSKTYSNLIVFFFFAVFFITDEMLVSHDICMFDVKNVHFTGDGYKRQFTVLQQTSLPLVLIRRCVFVFPARTGRCDREANERREALTRTEIFLKSRCRNNP